MRKAVHVAMREFKSTVMTKGFIIGILVTPLVVVIMIGGAWLTKHLKGPTLVGEILVIDRTGGAASGDRGVVAPGVVDAFSPEGLEREAERVRRETGEASEKAAKMLGVDDKEATQIKNMTQMSNAPPAAPADLAITVLDPATDPEPLKNSLKSVDITEKDDQGNPKRQRVAVAVIEPKVLKTDEDGRYGGFDLFTAQRIDFQIQERIARRIGRAIVDARLATDQRIHASGVSSEQIRAIVRAPEPDIQTMTHKGARTTNEIASLLIPFGFMILLMLAVMTCGQYLVTTVVEEKSNRVMEVLLSAVSPLELMVGKIMGQMLVGMLILIMGTAVSITALLIYAQSHLLQPVNLIYIVIFFFIAFFVVASMMAAVGSAVTELREAQTLLTPIMISVFIPYLLCLPVSRAPNSMFSTVLSFVPVINPFVMAIRLGGSEPIPAWQPPVSVLVGLVGVVFCGWAAAKVFRVGVLMYGKPPNLKTLIQWVRMA